MKKSTVFFVHLLFSVRKKKRYLSLSVFWGFGKKAWVCRASSLSPLNVCARAVAAVRERAAGWARQQQTATKGKRGRGHETPTRNEDNKRAQDG